MKGARWSLDIFGHYRFGHGEFEKIGHFLRKIQENVQTADLSTQLAPLKLSENLKIMKNRDKRGKCQDKIGNELRRQ